MLGCIAEMWRVGSKLFLKEFLLHTLPETNTAFENRPSQNETSIPAIHFQVHFFFLCVLWLSGPLWFEVGPCSSNDDTNQCDDHDGNETSVIFLDSSPKGLD